MTKKVLIAVDLSKLAVEVVSYGCRLAKDLGAEAAIVHAVPDVLSWKGAAPSVPMNLGSEMEVTARKRLQSYVDKAEAVNPGAGAVVREIVILKGDPTKAVTDYASANHYSLIIVGYRGQSAIERLLVGSTASSIARYSEGSVLIFRPSVDNF